MINVNRSNKVGKVIGIILVGVGSSTLIGALLYFSPYILQWLTNYPAWVLFLVGFVVFSLGVFLAVTEHIKSTEKAQETDGDSCKEEN